jgi:hypothetical protein
MGWLKQEWEANIVLKALNLRLARLVFSSFVRIFAICFCGWLMFFGLSTDLLAVSEPAETMGPNACAECHKQEAEAWKATPHFSTFKDMPRNAEAKKIAAKMGVKRVKTESLCLNCHFTVQAKGNKEEPIAGISCESCHSGGRDWIKVHSSFSGKTEPTETKSEEAERWKQADSKGMIRPGSLYLLARNCYGCHVVPQEDLVNKGGHKAGSAFELVAWSQGVVRHNTWYNKGKENRAASAERKRMLYLVGLGVELETGLRAVGNSTARKRYAFEMARRVDTARRKLSAAAKAAPDVPEITQLVEFAYSASLSLNNAGALKGAADGVSKLLVSISQKYDGSTMAGLDSLMPAPDKFKGKARAPVAQ